MTSAIVMHGLTKDYGSGHGLFDLDLEGEEGEVFGFLGPNGAGKTTTIRLLMGVIHATSGSASIFGLDCDRESVAVKREVGYLPGDLPQFGGMRRSRRNPCQGARRPAPTRPRPALSRVLSRQQTEARSRARLHAPSAPAHPRRTDGRARPLEPADISP